jgi:hypothetical protein
MEFIRGHKMSKKSIYDLKHDLFLSVVNNDLILENDTKKAIKKFFLDKELKKLENLNINEKLKNIDLKNHDLRLNLIKEFFNISHVTSNSYREEFILSPLNEITREYLKVNCNKDLLINLIENHFIGAWGNHVNIDNNFNIKVIEYND